jgi:hypothetical protein
MAQNHPAPSGLSIPALVGGIVDDIRELLKLEFDLAKRGVSQEFKKAHQALLLLRLARGCAALGGLLFVFMLVYLLQWVAGDRVPLWSCYGIVGAALTTVACGLFSLGKRKACQVQVMPEQTIATMTEAFQQTVHETTDTVKNALDLSGPIQRHPWAMLAGSLVAGYLLGQRVAQRHPSSKELRAPKETLLTELAKTFAPEMQEVKGLAIGILMARVRDALKRSAAASG